MRPETAFQIVQLLPLPIWLAWILLPNSRAARHLATAVWPWIGLAIVYASCLATALVSGGRLGPESFSSLSGMMSLFDPPWGALTAWTHYLCFDTFVARWMVNSAPAAGYRLAPALIATMMFGPLGLLVFWSCRRWLTPRAASSQLQRPLA